MRLPSSSQPAGADGDDVALLRLLFGGVRDDDAARQHFFLDGGPDDDAVVQRHQLGAAAAACFAGALPILAPFLAAGAFLAVGRDAVAAFATFDEPPALCPV